MDVFLMIRRHKTHIFCDAKENSTVAELKKIVQGILHVEPSHQQLYKVEDERDLTKAKPLADDDLLNEVGLTSSVARAQHPALIGLSLKKDDGTWEAFEVTKVSDPPELPDVMKNAQSDSHGGQQSDGQTIS